MAGQAQSRCNNQSHVHRSQEPIPIFPMLSLLQASLCGLYHRKGMGEEVREELEQDMNPFTKLPYSDKYKKLLEKRKQLPAFARMDEFYEVYSRNQIMIIDGETGCGKTTQIPQFVVHYDLPHKKGKAVACTQPRRVAAMSVAKRVAEEMDVRLGRQVGYSIRFENMTEHGTFLKYMTDGMLLREAMRDPDLLDYSTIILDEVHERTLATDVLMGLLKSLAKKRSDLKIIIMSATLDTLKFQKYFGFRSWQLAPLLKIHGRTHHVDVLYTKESETDYVEAAIRTVVAIHFREPPGDILLFLTGEDEIEESCKRIKMNADHHASSHPRVGPLVCLPLYGCLSPQQQQRVFDTTPLAHASDGPPERRVVVSTNIAETSLTIDGIVYVVDPGFSKQKMYDPSTRIESLLVKPISKASAKQREGRAGRTSAGKCFRLYTKQYFNEELEEQNRPEILRCNLSSIVLLMKKLGIRDVGKFDYVDAPDPESLMRAHELLYYIEATDRKGDLTSLGKTMAEFPLEPQLSKMLISSPRDKCSNEILTITAMLSVQNVWVRPHDQKHEADDAKAKLTIPDGDHLTLLNVYNQYQQNSNDKKWASRNFVSQRSLMEAEKIHNHLQHLMERYEIKLISHPDESKLHRKIRKALVSGFFMQVARKVREEGPYLTVKEDQVVALHQSCGLNTLPEWVIFNEVVLTSRNYIRTVSEVKPEWLLEIAPNYFNISSFPEGETKWALQRVANVKPGGNPDTTGRLMNILKKLYVL